MVRFRRLFNRDNIFVLIITAVIIGLILMPTGFEERFPRSAERVRGLVLEVDNSGVQQFGIVKSGAQGLRVKILEGPFEGLKVNATNTLLGTMELDKFFKVGDIALVILDVKGNVIVAATAFDHYRLNIELILFVLFALFLVLFAGWTGAKTLLSFIFTATMLWKVLLPLFLKNYDPILVSLGVMILLTMVIMILIGGMTKKSLVAFLGAFFGILLTCGLSFIFFPPFHVHGAVRPFSETLLYSGFPYLDLNRLFLAGIFIAASGAVMDMAMDVSASMNEVIQKKPDISVRELIGSGFAVGRAVIGTMTTTLLLAYSGGYTAMLMLFISKGMPMGSMVNINYVAAQILHTLVGSFGLVTVAPFTAIIGGFIYLKWGGDHGQKIQKV